jgi:hypothetical protein
MGHGKEFSDGLDTYASGVDMPGGYLVLDVHQDQPLNAADSPICCRNRRRTGLDRRFKALDKPFAAV